MTKFPCPSCRKQRASIGATCEGCGWSPLSASVPINDPWPDFTPHQQVSHLVGKLGVLVGVLHAQGFRFRFDFAEGWLAAIVFSVVGLVAGFVLLEAAVHLATEIAIWTSNDRHLEHIHPKYSDTKPTSSKTKKTPP
jgi:hypothetical protein